MLFHLVEDSVHEITESFKILELPNLNLGDFIVS